MRKNKGITLIALVITIIVMLILVAVTISMAVNGGLFGYAGNAARGTEAEKQKETRLANVPSNLSTNALIDYYTKGEVEMATFTWTGRDWGEPPQTMDFEVGMTWEEWINSDYNILGVGEDHFEIFNNHVCFRTNAIDAFGGSYSGDPPGRNADSEIIANVIYGYFVD